MLRKQLAAKFTQTLLDWIVQTGLPAPGERRTNPSFF